MRKRAKDRIAKDIASLAALRDDAIDCSEIPEVADWSDAVTGRFHRRTNKSVTVLLPDPEPHTPGWRTALMAKLRDIAKAWKQSHSQPEQSANRKSIRERAKSSLEPWTDDLVDLPPRSGVGSEAPLLLAELPDSAAKQPSKANEMSPEQSLEMFRRFHPLITTVVVAIMRRQGSFPTDLIDDVIQHVWLRLFKALGNNRIRDEKLPAWVEITAKKVALEHFREHSGPARLAVSQLSKGADASQIGSERELVTKVMLSEIEARLSSRERVIFKLYLQGYTPKEISAFPEVNMSEMDVKVLLHRIATIARSELGARHVPGS